jgi:hypothetical protein
MLSLPMPETALGRIGYYVGGAAPIFLIAALVFLAVRILMKGGARKARAAAWGAAIFVIALIAVRQL